MFTLAICGSDIAALNPDNATIATLEIAGTNVTAGLMNIPEPGFDPSSPDQRDSVLLRTDAFSCNYRDIALIARAGLQLPPDRFYSIGSEFVGTVIEIGDDVTKVGVGDRVIPDGAYPGDDGLPGGLPTNHGSRQLQVIDQRKLLVIPETVDDAVAASFTIGGQTTYAMVRRLGVGRGSDVLVTAARSNTSLFAVQALRRVGCEPTVITSAPTAVEDLRRVGAARVFVVDPGVATYADVPELLDYAKARRGFDGVIDPFFDVNLHRLVPLLAHGARYITCGMADQYSYLTGTGVPNAVGGAPVGEVMGAAMMHNLELSGNCLGTTDDLQRALADYVAGELDVVIDSVHSDGDVAAFLHRTYGAPDRFGKVVYRYVP